MNNAREFRVVFTGTVVVLAQNEEQALGKAEEELSWSRSRFDLTDCREV